MLWLFQTASWRTANRTRSFSLAAKMFKHFQHQQAYPGLSQCIESSSHRGLTSLVWSRISQWPWDGSELMRKGPSSWSRDSTVLQVTASPCETSRLGHGHMSYSCHSLISQSFTTKLGKPMALGDLVNLNVLHLTPTRWFQFGFRLADSQQHCYIVVFSPWLLHGGA